MSDYQEFAYLFDLCVYEDLIKQNDVELFLTIQRMSDTNQH